METLELALVLLFAVLISSIIEQLIPKVTAPLIQIALGIIIAFLANGRIEITLDPDFFLIMFIAPLLFDAARKADNTALWKNRGAMLSFAIFLVVVIMVVIGFSVNLMIPSVSLAAALALGAALGPTDPVAVASVSEEADIDPRQESILKGESLLNDASGIVSFQFALAAATTGSFSVASAIEDFLVSFFGGLAAGILLGWLTVKAVDAIRNMGLENTTFHVLLEVFIPFIAYLLGEAIGVSGIILVVACGITMTLTPQTLRPSISRMNIVSTSVWQVISFTLNGIVFVLLGTQLPSAIGNTWLDGGVDEFMLLVYVLVITFLMHAVRFVWSLASERHYDHKTGKRRSTGELMRAAGILTLSGSKGAITLAIMFSIPAYVQYGSAWTPFPNRGLLIFIASGVIVISLLLATFVVPLLAPKKESENDTRERDLETKIDIYRTVVAELTAQQTPETRMATNQVIEQYNERIALVKDESDAEYDSSTELRITVLQWEQEYVLDQIDAGEFPTAQGYAYVSRIARIETMLKRDQHRSASIISWWHRTRRRLHKSLNALFKHEPPEQLSVTRKVYHDIQLDTNKYIVNRLEQEMADPDSPFAAEQISQLIIEYQRSIALLRPTNPSVTAYTRLSSYDLDITRLSLRIELEEIQRAYDDGRLSRSAAQNMRKNVYLMQLDVEDYV